MSRNTDKIIKAVVAKGWKINELSWTPIGTSCEMCGPDGGWFLEIEYYGKSHSDFETIGGYNIAEVMEQIGILPDYSREAL